MRDHSSMCEHRADQARLAITGWFARDWHPGLWLRCADSARRSRSDLIPATGRPLRSTSETTAGAPFGTPAQKWWRWRESNPRAAKRIIRASTCVFRCLKLASPPRTNTLRISEQQCFSRLALRLGLCASLIAMSLCIPSGEGCSTLGALFRLRERSCCQHLWFCRMIYEVTGVLDTLPWQSTPRSKPITPRCQRHSHYNARRDIHNPGLTGQEPSLASFSVLSSLWRICFTCSTRSL